MICMYIMHYLFYNSIHCIIIFYILIIYIKYIIRGYTRFTMIVMSDSFAVATRMDFNSITWPVAAGGNTSVVVTSQMCNFQKGRSLSHPWNSGMFFFSHILLMLGVTCFSFKQ